MTREIKFRAWDKSALDMVSSEDMENQVWNIYASMRNSASDWLYMQFTGLKDKNGKEIYEGDILVIYNDTLGAEKNAIGEIKWQYGCFEFSGDNAMGNVHSYDKDYIEIIGNIYENPELLGSIKER